MHKLNKQCDTNKYASEYKCGSTDRDLNSFNSECGWALASCLSQISQGWVTKMALTSQQCLKSSKRKSTASSIPNLEYFLNSVQVTLKGASVVPALFTITILSVSPRRINEFMRSLMTTMHGGGSRYTDAPFERTKSFITRTHAGINTDGPRTSRPWKTRTLVRPLGYLDVLTEAHHSPRDGDVNATWVRRKHWWAKSAVDVSAILASPGSLQAVCVILPGKGRPAGALIAAHWTLTAYTDQWDPLWASFYIHSQN